MLANYKRAGVVFTAICLSVSMTGCFDLPVKEKTVNRDALLALIKEDDFVTPWKGDIPDGMEVQYVMVREKTAAVNDFVTEYEYGYDGYGRRTSLKNVKENGYTIFEMTYDDNGHIISKKQSSDGYVGSAPFPEIEFNYRYDDSGRMVYYEQIRSDRSSSAEFVYNEDGHLIRVNKDNSMLVCSFNFDNPPYHEVCAVLDDSLEQMTPWEVVVTYDEDGNVISETHDGYTTDYLYEDGVLTGRKETDPQGTVVTYDADGIKLKQESADGSQVLTWQYNEHGDNVYFKMTRDGELDRERNTKYVYDDNGNILKSTETMYYPNYYEKGEVTTVTTRYYTYDKNGLRTSETVEYEAGKTSEVTVYYYEAILVPVKE